MGGMLYSQEEDLLWALLDLLRKPKEKKASDTDISEQKPLDDGLGSGNNQEWVGRREEIIDVPPPLAPPYHHHR